MRETHVKKEMVLMPVRSTTITCDKCGKPITYDDNWGDKVAHEIVISLDGIQCVNFFRRRDYCDKCNTPIWEAINELIGAEPWVERDRDYDEM